MTEPNPLTNFLERTKDFDRQSRKENENIFRTIYHWKFLEIFLRRSEWGFYSSFLAKSIVATNLAYITGIYGVPANTLTDWDKYYCVVSWGEPVLSTFFWMTVLSTTVLSTKKWIFAKSQFYPLLEILLKIPLYPLYLQMKR